MINIAICDDEPNVCEKLENMCHTFEEKSDIQVKVDVYYSALNILDKINTNIVYDLIFLDIQMDELDGIEFGKNLREKMKDERTKIIYISWEESYIWDLLEIRPFDFIVKPLKQEAVSKCLYKVYDVLTSDKNYIRFQTKGRYEKIYFSDIYYIETDAREVVFRTIQGEKRFYGSLEEVMKELDSRIFWRIHKSFVINYNHVKLFTYENVTLDTDKVLTISQKYRTRIKELKKEYWGFSK